MRTRDPVRRSHDGFQLLRTQDGPPADDGETFDVGKYLTALRRRWPLLVVCAILAGAFALIRFSLTTKEYRATSTIQIERKRLSLMAMGQAGWLEDWWNMEYYPTQYRLLRSRGMAERVVANLRLHEDPSFTGRAASLVPTDGSPATSADDAAALARLAARLQGGLSVNPIRDTQLVELSYHSSSPELAARVANGYAEAFIEWGKETRISTVGRASSFLSAQIDTLRQEIEERQQHLNAYTSDLDIALDPAGEVLLERRQTLEKEGNRIVAERISKESAYRQLLSLPDETIANTASGGRVTQLKEEIFELESNYSSKLGTYRPEWPEMVELKAKIDDKRDQLQRLVQEKVNEARDQAHAEYQKARAEEGTIQEELRKLAAESRQLNSSALEYNSLVTQIETKKDLLSELLKRQSETEVASRVQTSQDSNVRIVDRAVVPAHPFRPTLRSNLTQALFIGLLVGMGLVFLIEYLDRTIKTPEELENLLGLPTLAVVPDVDETRRTGLRLRYGKTYGYGYSYGYGYGYGYGGSGKRSRAAGKGQRPTAQQGKASSEPEHRIELLPHHNPRLAICEAYRSLRTAILLSSAQELKVVTVTSAEPGEGKTVTTVNLAVVMAQLGRRVLIIDADLRRPRMHKVLKVSNRYGLVHYLTGQVAVDRLFIDTRIPNLFVCPAGPIPPNPSELLSSQRMDEGLTAGRQAFDMVLIDTPPVLPVADAIIIGTQADGVVLCARAGELQRDDAIACRERLKYEKIKILGTVLNRYRSRPGRYTRYGKYYGTYEEPAPVEVSHAA